MSAFVPPPPPSGVVVPPPPPVVVSGPPAAVPASSSAVAGSATSVIKPGGVMLDMSTILGPRQNVAKKSLPPWAKKLATPLSVASPSADNSTPPPAPVAVKSKSHPMSLTAEPALAAGAPNNPAHRTNVEASSPSLSSLPPAAAPLPQSVVNVPVVVTRKSLPTASLITTSPTSASLPYTSVMAGPVASSPQPAASAPSPPVHPVVEAATSSAANTATPLPLVSSSAPPPPRTTPIALAEVPAPASATACASTLPLPAPGVNQTAPVAVPTIPQGAMQKTLSTPSPAAIATTACIVQETMRTFRPHLAPPTYTVITPHVVFQEEEQKVVVSPLPPVPPREAKKVPSAAAGSAGNWRNRYDLQPSPSFGAAQHYGSEPLATNAATSSARRQWTSKAVINSPKPMSNWRETYWQHVDVHRYVARRYFGAPPPLEQ